MPQDPFKRASIRTDAAATFPLKRMTLHFLLLLLLNSFTLIERGFGDPVGGVMLWRSLQLLVFAFVIGRAVWQAVQIKQWRSYLHQHWPRWSLFILALLPLLTAALFTRHPFTDPAFAITQTIFGLLLILSALRWQLAITERFLAPNVQMLISFILIIATGTGLLSLPAARNAEAGAINPIDALFMATSATCVTGLSTTSVSDLTTFGQIVLLGLIQIGALGVVLFGSLLAMMVGRKQSLREIFSESQSMSTQSGDLNSLARFVFFFTLTVEFIGALLIWIPLYNPDETLHGFAEALFISISAYCNAGFTTGPDNLLEHRHHPLATAIVGLLILFGGLGFPVWLNLCRVGWRDCCKFILKKTTHPIDLMRRRNQGESPVALTRLTLHTKMVLTMTLALIVIGTALFFIAQLSDYASWNNNTSVPNAPDRTLNTQNMQREFFDALFWSITSRTAGFNNAPMTDLSHNPSSKLLMMGMMIIGGSPASTAGGLKTITFFILMIAAWSILRGKQQVSIFKRHVPQHTIRHAVALLGAFFVVHALATAILCVTESNRIINSEINTMELLFEVISATSTVGLSLGITSELSTQGKMIITACMFIGRVGPLIGLAPLITRMVNRTRYQYTTESMLLT